MADSYSKKENNKKKIKKKQDKQSRREDRKVNNNKGKSLEDMLVYVDANGNLTSVPPHLQPVEPIKKKRDTEENATKSDAGIGMITYMNEKGYGFITEKVTGDNIFFNFESDTAFKRGMKVQFKKESSHKGFRASGIVIIN